MQYLEGAARGALWDSNVSPDMWTQGQKQREQDSGMLAWENEVWGMLKQEDFSNYALPAVKDSVDPYPYYILLGTTQLPQCSLNYPPTALPSLLFLEEAPAPPGKQSYLFPSPDHRFQPGSCVADGGLWNVCMAVWEKTTEH